MSVRTTPDTMRDYLRMIFRRKAALFIPLFVGVLLIAPGWMLMPPKYRASATVRRKDLSIINASPASMLARPTYSVPLNTMREEILTWTNLDRVIRQLKMDRDLKTPAEWQKRYEDLRGSVTIKALAEEPGIALVEIAAISSSPDMAKDVANAVANNYIEESKKAERQDNQTAVDFFEKGTQEYQSRLRDTEEILDSYRQEHFVDLPEVKKDVFGRLLTLQTNETSSLLQVTALKNQLAELEKQMGQVATTVKSESTTVENPSAVGLQTQLIEKTRALDALLINYTEEHPAVKQLRKEIATIQIHIQETPARVPGVEREIINPVWQQLASEKLLLVQQIKGQEAALRQIRAEMAANEEKVREVAGMEKQYGDIVRQKTEYDEVYNQYRQSLLTARTRLEAQTQDYGTRVDMVAMARPPSVPYRMDHLKLAFACLAGGVGMGISLMFLLEFFDHSLRGVDDAAQFLGVPVMGSLTVFENRLPSDRRQHPLATKLVIIALIILTIVGVLLLLEQWRPGILAQNLARVKLFLQAHSFK